METRNAVSQNKTTERIHTTQPPSNYRGVLRRQNGRWGAQIFKKKQHIWLGSFGTAVEAAKAYDLAAHSLNGCRAKTNFTPSSSNSGADIPFLQSQAATDVANMLRIGVNTQTLKHRLHKDQSQHLKCYNAGCKVSPDAKRNHELLFHKVVSISDLSPRTRLWMPRQYPWERAPFGLEPTIQNFEDEAGKIWSFQYTLWRGSHVLNRGWPYFVREKGIKEGDVITFWRVTDERGTVRLLIHCDTMGHAQVASPTLQISEPQPGSTIRLFGANIPTQAKNLKTIINLNTIS